MHIVEAEVPHSSWLSVNLWTYLCRGELDKTGSQLLYDIEVLGHFSSECFSVCPLGDAK